jgi:HlyD family secretion protein
MGMRRLAVVLALAALGGLAWMWLGRGRGADDGLRYLTVAVERGPITATVTATGTLNPLVSVQVGTYVSGPIQALSADFNTQVRRGQALAKIDPRTFQMKVDEAEADVANARAQLRKDQADAALRALTLRRNRSLAAKGIVSTSDLDLAVAQDQQGRAQVALDAAQIQSAEAKLQEARVNLAYTDIVSPVDGVVVSRNVDMGQTVAASFQTPVLFVVAEDLAKMQVNVSVSESDIGPVAVGQEATFTVDAYPAATFGGRVTQVRNAPITVQNVVTYDVVVGVDNAELRLKPGMTANVAIKVAERPDALRVPTGALRFRPTPEAGTEAGTKAGTGAPARADHGPRLWLLGADGKPQPVAVTTGVADDRYTEVTSGVGEGQQIVTGIRRESAGTARAAAAPSFAPGRMRH